MARNVGNLQELRVAPVWPQQAKRDLGPPATKNKFWQQPECVQKQILPRVSRKEDNPANILIHTCEKQALPRLLPSRMVR